MPTKQELSAGLAIVKAVADTVKELGRAPRGVLYAGLMTRGLSLNSYEQIEGMLCRAGLVRIESDCLVWNA